MKEVVPSGPEPYICTPTPKQEVATYCPGVGVTWGNEGSSSQLVTPVCSQAEFLPSLLFFLTPPLPLPTPIPEPNRFLGSMKDG